MRGPGMGVIKYTLWATRDVIGGGLGGLAAAWVLADVYQPAVTITMLVSIFALAAIYLIMDWMKEEEEARLSDGGQAGEADEEPTTAGLPQSRPRISLERSTPKNQRSERWQHPP